MSIIYKLTTQKDQPTILALMKRYSKQNLTPEERQKEGFTQGTLTTFQQNIGIYGAFDEDTLIGVLMAAKLGTHTQGPPGSMLEALKTTLPKEQLEKTFSYGPVAIDKNYRGQGLFSKMLSFMCQDLKTHYQYGVCFVEHSNEKSLAIHRHYPMEECVTFTFKGNLYSIFLFQLVKIVEYYQNS